MAVIVVDFSGTLIKPSVVEDANLKRLDILGIAHPSEEEHKKQHATKEHYEEIKQRISEKYGISDDMKISYVQNHGEKTGLTGKEMQTMIMTDLFRDAMYEVVKEQGKDIFREGMVEVLEELDHKLIIVSGIRTDIITGMLAIAGCDIPFEVYGQDPVLSRDNNEKQIEALGKIDFIIGDKENDLTPGKKVGAKTIFFKGGHPTGGEEEIADFTIEKAEELKEIIK